MATESATQVVTAHTTVVVSYTSTDSMASSTSNTGTDPSSSSASNVNVNASNNSQKDNNNNDSFFDSAGKVAGVFTVVGVVCVGIIASIVYCCFFKRSHDNDDDSDSDDDLESQMKGKNDAATTQHSVENESSDDTVVGHGMGPHGRQMSIVSTDFGTPIIDRRGDSTYVDQRLDVGHFNEEEEEIKSLNDNEDYSRKVWRVMNP